jgi:MarR family transcriptional regulator, organic hydroperoxide resistance regulator
VVALLLLDLQRATHVTLAALAAELADLGLAASEANVLANLADAKGEVTVSRLANLVGSRPTTMTAVLDRLERRGWVARRAHPSDRRALLVELTPEGRTVARSVRRAYDRVEEKVVETLSPSAARSLRASLRRIAEEWHA